MRHWKRPLVFAMWILVGLFRVAATDPKQAPPAIRWSPGLAEAPIAKRLESSVSPPAWREYLIGDPSSEEQLYLELINRARAFPWEEGYLLATSLDPDIQFAPVKYTPKEPRETPGWIKWLSDFFESLFEPLGRKLGMSWPVLSKVLIALAVIDWAYQRLS